jgi:hypothetical protein
MKTPNKSTEALALADTMIRERFEADYGTTCRTDYLAHLDGISTRHLVSHLKDQALKAAGQQRSNAKLCFSADPEPILLIQIPMDDPHKPGATIYATLDFASWLDLMEMGAHGAWRFNAKGRQRGGQVLTRLPMWRSCLIADVAIARLLTNAKPGQQSRTLDGNPLNLRRSNLYLLGNPTIKAERVGTAKVAARLVMEEAKAVQASYAGRGFDIPRID